MGPARFDNNDQRAPHTMDDLEFRTRAFSDPQHDSNDLQRAAGTDANRQRLLEEITELDNEIRRTVGTVPIPDGLKQRLLQHSRPTWHSRAPYVLAASLLVTAGLGLSMVQTRPSAQDLAFHDALLNHVHREAPRYANSTGINWSDVEPVLQAAGARMASQAEVEALHLTFANHCGFGGGDRGAHLVAQGEFGPVSIIFTPNTPVANTIKLRDERYKGRIIPLSGGNMAVIGEKQEGLRRFEKVVMDNLEWSL